MFDKNLTTYIDKNASKWDTIEAIQNAYRLAKQRLISMGAQKVNLKIVPTGSATDGKTLTVSTKVFDDNKIPVSSQLDVFLGETVHEGLHILHTSFKDTHPKNKFHMQIMNIIEDERIERICAEQYPGYAAYLKVLHDYYFKLIFNKSYPENKIAECFQLLFCYVRCPYQIDADMASDNATFMAEMTAILSPFPETFKQMVSCSEKILDLFKGMGEKEDKKDDGEGESGKDSSKEKDGEKSESTSGPDGSDEKEAGKGEKSEKEEGRSAEEVMQEIADMVKGLLDSAANPDGAKEVEISEEIKEEFIQRAIENGDLDIKKKVFANYAEGSKKEYSRLKKEVAPFISVLRRNLFLTSQDRTNHLTGLRSGNLDTRKLAEAWQGAPTVYTQTTEHRKKKVNLCLLVDQSGSMGGQRIETAQKIATLFLEATKGVQNLNLFVYGHTADRPAQSTQVVIYREPGFNKNECISSCQAMANNRDGVAIDYVAERVRKFTQEPCLFIVLADGQPSASSYNMKEGITHTKAVVETISKKGFIPIQVGIQTTFGAKNPMFENSVEFHDLSQMVKELSKLLRKELGKLW